MMGIDLVLMRVLLLLPPPPPCRCALYVCAKYEACMIFRRQAMLSPVQQRKGYIYYYESHLLVV